MHKPTDPDYGDPITDLWICDATVFCSSYSPDAVRNGGLTWTGKEFLCPICKTPMQLDRKLGT